MSNSYLITIDTNPHQEKDELLNYILQNVNIHEIDEIKCYNADDVALLCKNNINELGTVHKQKEDSIELCKVCNSTFNTKQMIFCFSSCEHSFHKKCMTKHLKSCKTNICPICKDKNLEKIMAVM